MLERCPAFSGPLAQAYMLTDSAIAHAAEALGLSEDARVLRLRAANYSKLFSGCAKRGPYKQGAWIG